MTTKFNKFELHSAFRDGKLNEKYFVDLPYLKEEQRRALASFLGAITREEPLPGKNKPSWLMIIPLKFPVLMRTKTGTTGIIIAVHIQKGSNLDR
ncbi:hypothetical protein EPU35_24900 [Escherichia coli]|nr:hypothetical protein EPU35_24900 [Escherichia coli]